MTKITQITHPIECPFCYEDDFDLIGLKLHLMNGWCETFNNVPVSDQVTAATAPKE